MAFFSESVQSQHVWPGIPNPECFLFPNPAPDPSPPWPGIGKCFFFRAQEQDPGQPPDAKPEIKSAGPYSVLVHRVNSVLFSLSTQV